MSESLAVWHPPVVLPPGVVICQTLRGGAGWGFNLATHVGAPPEGVAQSRAALQAHLPDVEHIQWLTQVHGTAVMAAPADADRIADAQWTPHAGVVCAVMTADCLPVLMWSEDGSVVAAAHAGWRGLAAGVLEATLERLPVAPQAVQVWLGPRIGQANFEVGPEVRAAFMASHPAAEQAFIPSSRAGYFLADLSLLATQRLQGLGVRKVVDSAACTVSDPSRWFSFRREGQCGRMASLIWRKHGA